MPTLLTCRCSASIFSTIGQAIWPSNPVSKQWGSLVSEIENRRDQAEPVDEKRRAAVFTMAKVATYAAPIVTTFAMGGMSVREAHAYVTNLSE